MNIVFQTIKNYKKSETRPKNNKNAQSFGDMAVRQCLSALVSGLSAGSFFWGVANSAFWFGFIAALWSAFIRPFLRSPCRGDR